MLRQFTSFSIKMVSFSCFGTSLHSNKPKKSAHQEIQEKNKSSQSLVITLSADCNCNFKDADEQCINSPKIEKSLSIGSMLDQEGQASKLNDLEGGAITSFDRRLSLKSDVTEKDNDIHEEILSGKDFKTRRIQDWVTNQLDCSVFDDESCNVVEHQAKEVVVTGRLESKIDDPGMEVAKRYISSLSLTASSAQLANHGLPVIPFLSVFGCLKTINLSGNAIARITPGSLPRGLHSLNLSKNNISVIEGLRELTRLRVLDLSCNRIFRIGHGLASCSSLKELYLAGNKISDAEGLHRLLKLSVLDLGFNKISTSKSLGELAANYSSLQAINLEGNPAQKNVGDAQLKKYLQGLLPRLAHYNKQPIKTGSLKDITDRSTRLGVAADRGHRSEHKTVRKAGMSRHQIGYRASDHKLPYSDLGGASWRPKHSMKRCQSEGVLSQHLSNLHLK